MQPYLCCKDCVVILNLYQLHILLLLMYLYLTFLLSLVPLSRALRVETASPPARRQKTFCHLTRSKSRESARGRDNENGRSERLRDADTRKGHAVRGTVSALLKLQYSIILFISYISYKFNLLSVTGSVTTAQIGSVSESVCLGKKRKGST